MKPIAALLVTLLQLTSCQYIPEKLSNGNLAGTSFGIAAHNATFDYIVVGGGLGGSVVASRLAEDPNVTVALVEPGTFYETTNGNNSQVPYYSTKFIGSEPTDYQPLIDWSLITVPQAGADNMKIHYAQGKNLGGSSGRNQMIYHRGTVGAFKKWAEHVGDDSYEWDNYFKFFQKSTQFTPPAVDSLRAPNSSAQYKLSAYTKSGGPLHVSFPNFALPFSSYGAAAFKAIGMKEATDFSSGTLNGYAYNPFTIDPNTGLRSSSETSFLSSAIQSPRQRQNPNLQIYTLTQASKILFDDKKAATGVKVRSSGYDYVLSARKEVILSAGAWHSPQLLMLSGIGPKATLQEHKIPVVADRPGVGQNMWDTTNVGGVTHRVNVETDAVLNTPAGMHENVEQFLVNRTGYLANHGSDLLAWHRLPKEVVASLSKPARAHLAKFPSDWPTIEYTMSSSGGNIAGEGTTGNLGTIGVLLIATASRGNMTISSASIDDRPVISPNWLLDPIDQEIAVAAVRQVRKAWKAIDVKIGKELKPGADARSYGEILKKLRANVTPIHHASSSCAMGKRSNPQAVVDSNAHVIGVKKLRVIDSSSFPFTPPGHTQGYTYAHAEKLVNDIKMGL